MKTHIIRTKDTEDHKYFIVGDEFIAADGINKEEVLDLTDLDNPQLHYDDTINIAIDHNGYIVGNRFYLASIKQVQRNRYIK